MFGKRPEINERAFFSSASKVTTHITRCETTAPQNDHSESKPNTKAVASSAMIVVGFVWRSASEAVEQWAAQPP